MSDIAPVSGVPGGLDLPPLPSDRPSSARPADRLAARPSDRVDLSERARFLTKLASMPPVRRDVVDRVRRQLDAGSYDSDEVVDRTVSSIIRALDVEA